MNDDVVAFSENHSRHILRRRRSGLDEVEESVSFRLDMALCRMELRASRSRSDLPSAAIDEEFDARDETGVVRS
jgi:hypothetical protein